MPVAQEPEACYKGPAARNGSLHAGDVGHAVRRVLLRRGNAEGREQAASARGMPWAVAERARVGRARRGAVEN